LYWLIILKKLLQQISAQLKWKKQTLKKNIESLVCPAESLHLRKTLLTLSL
jgi:hypothetical protein